MIMPCKRFRCCYNNNCHCCSELISFVVIVQTFNNKMIIKCAFCRREDNLDVEIAASGFTKDMESTFDEVNNVLCQMLPACRFD